MRKGPNEHGVPLHGLCDALRIHHVVFDPLADKMRATAPVAMPELFARWEAFQGLSLTELQGAFDACQARFRAWVEAPENAGRPITEAPDYLDRIALDSLLERRIWSE